MQIIQAREYRRSFRVDPWDVERLVHILGGDGRIARVHVEFGDGSSAVLRHAGELSDLPNQSSRPIERLWFECQSPAFATEAEPAPGLVVVELRDRGPYGIALHVSGEELSVRTMMLELDRWAASVTPWFGRLAFLGRTGLLATALLALGCLTSIALAVAVLISGTDLAGLGGAATTLGTAARVAAGACLSVLAGAIAYVIARPERVFPRAQFRLGREAQRWRRADRRRGLVVGATGTAAVVTAVAVTLASLL